MYCPRCGAENEDARAACWNCFAQLRAPAGAKPLKVEPKKAKPVAAVQPVPEPEPVPEIEPEPEAAPAAEEVAAPALAEAAEAATADSKVLDLGEPVAKAAEPAVEVEPAAEVQPEPEPIPAPAEEAPGPPSEAAEEEPIQPESKVLNLDEPVVETEQAARDSYIVPGLAEPEPEAEEETPSAETPAPPEDEEKTG